MGAKIQRVMLDVVESAYRLDGDEDAWLTRVLEAARPALDRGMGVMGVTSRVSAGRREFSRPLTVGHVPEGFVDTLKSLSSKMTRSEVEQSWVRPRALDTYSATYERRSGGAPFARWAFFDALRRLGVRDNLAAQLTDPAGHGVLLLSPMPAEGAIDDRDEARWSMVMTHVVAALRLRQSLTDGDGDAVLDSAGRVVHAEGASSRADAREALRRAAACIDRARSRAGRGDPDASLAAWKGLVSGRWSLIDRFEQDGRRFFVARRNAPDPVRPEGLSLRERQVVAYAALGYSNKQIGYALGIATSTVATHLRNAQRRLGVARRAELGLLFGGALPDDGEPRGSSSE